MISKEFPYNSVLKSMQYNGEFLSLLFKKKQNKIQTRIYRCEKEIAYKLYYCKKSKESLEIFSNEIVDKLEVVNVTEK